MKILHKKLNQYIIISSVLTILIIISCFFVFFQRKSAVDTVTVDYPQPLGSEVQFNSFWKKKVNQLGAGGAYIEFKKAYARFKAMPQHVAIHRMGRILYSVKKESAIKLCDTAFEYGCYHGVIIEAASIKGLSAIYLLNKECLRDGLWVPACQHGIGHGLVEYFGHNEEGLLKAIKECENLNTSKELNGCADGAFMEFELPEGLEIRPLKSGNPNEICDLVTGEHDKDVCYYSMPQWWFAIFNAKYSHVIELCSNSIPLRYKKACITGIGADIAMRSYFKPDAILKVCNQLIDNDDRIACLAGAYWITQLVPERRAEVAAICQQLEADVKNQCLGN